MGGRAVVEATDTNGGSYQQTQLRVGEPSAGAGVFSRRIFTMSVIVRGDKVLCTNCFKGRLSGNISANNSHTST